MGTISQKDQELTEQVIQDYVWAKNYREQFEPDWIRAYRLYKSFIDKDDTSYPFESRLFIPYIFSVIEVQLPIIMTNLFSNGAFLEVEGRNIASQELAPLVKEIISYQFERDIKAFPLMSRWSKQALLYGTSPAFADWNYQVRSINTRVPKKSEKDIIQYVVRKIKKVLVNGPMADVIDIFRYFQCPTTVNSPSSDFNTLFAGWEFQKTYEELVMMANSGFLKRSQVDLLKGADARTDPLENRLNEISKVGPRDTTLVNRRKAIDLINYFGHVPNEKTGELEYKLITMAFPGGFPKGGSCEGIILNKADDPLMVSNIPIVLLRTNLMEGELYGTGDVQAVESLQIELNDQRNQRCDNVVRSMNQMWKVRTGTQIDESTMQFRPHGLVFCDDPAADILPLNPNTLQLNQSLVEENVIKQDIQFTTGVTDFIAGTAQNVQGFNETATGVSLIQAAAQGRLSLKTQFIQVAIKELAELVWKLDQQYLPYDSVIKVLDPFSASKFRFIRASPDVINGQYDFSIVNAPSTGNPQIRRQQLIQIIDGATKIIAPALKMGQPININYPQLLLRLFKEFNIPNIAEILPDLAKMEVINNVPSFVDQALDTGEDLLDPETENEMMLDGQQVQVKPGDDDLHHLLVHEKARRDSNDTEFIRIVDAHNSLHKQQLDKKKDLTLQTVTAGAGTISQGGVPGNNLVNELMQNAKTLEGQAQTGEMPMDMSGMGQMLGGSPNGAEGNEAITDESAQQNQIRGA